MVNNLGGTSNLEMGIIMRAALAVCKAKGLVVERCVQGALMTSFQMAGFSLTLLKVTDDVIARLDADTDVAAWPRCVKDTAVHSAPQVLACELSGPTPFPSSLSGQVLNGIGAVCEAMLACEPLLTKLDHATGDGDMGKSVEGGGKAVKALVATAVPSAESSPADVATALEAIGSCLGKDMGGSSGIFYNLAFNAASASMAGATTTTTTTTTTGPQTWAAALTAATEAIRKYGGAQLGSRTMLDALIPAAQHIEANLTDANAKECVAAAAQKASEGAESTANMSASAGRSSYIDPAAIKGHEDPGARFVALWLAALASTL